MHRPEGHLRATWIFTSHLRDVYLLLHAKIPELKLSKSKEETKIPVQSLSLLLDRKWAEVYDPEDRKDFNKDLRWYSRLCTSVIAHSLIGKANNISHHALNICKELVIDLALLEGRIKGDQKIVEGILVVKQTPSRI